VDFKLEDSKVVDSKLKNSKVVDSNLEDYEVVDSKQEDSKVVDSKLEDSKVVDSKLVTFYKTSYLEVLPTCGEETWEVFLLRKGERRSKDFFCGPGET